MVFASWPSEKSMAQFYQGYQMDFGKNRVQHQEFLWTYYRFKNFDTYFYIGGKDKLGKSQLVHADYCDKTHIADATTIDRKHVNTYLIELEEEEFVCRSSKGLIVLRPDEILDQRPPGSGCIQCIRLGRFLQPTEKNLRSGHTVCGTHG